MISVIITAYNRKEYVMNAIKSIKNADEIIVVKNFKDDTIDNQLVNEHKTKEIFCTNNNAGYFMAEGISNSSGDVICFLDDDDMFTENKLTTVSQIFSSNDIIFSYNSRYIINEKGDKVNEEILADKTIDSKNVRYLFRNRVYFNSSSMCIRRKVLEKYLESLYKIKRLVDNFFLLSAVSTQGKIRITSQKLTYYRFHSSSSRHITRNLEEFVNNRVKYFDDAIHDNDIMMETFEGNAKYAAECSKKMAEIQKCILEGKRCKNFILCDIYSAKTLTYTNLSSLVSLFLPNLPRKIEFNRYIQNTN
ncbi:glycosyltransferase family A protein [Acidianus sp. HS-5]|uniref:glycosyltransferase family 2 protein n=1 Tax=Acidianus sp. HS-5 TaxID=2886040 RepID=UPI001F483479|nr:glycosyltransferase family A protein [Acidianus sp. HS-5]